MAIGDGLPLADGVPDVGRIQRHLTAAARVVGVTAMALVWIAFWGMVARLHVQTGDLVSAGFVSVLFVVPAIAALAYVLRNALSRG